MGKKLSEIDFYELYTRWNNGSGCFRCFFRTTNFVSLKHYEDFELSCNPVDGKQFEKLLTVIDAYSFSDTVFVVDLPDAEAVNVAFTLQKNRRLKAIFTFNNILHPYGITGSREYISSLVSCGYELEPVVSGFDGFVFVLDSLRYGEYSDEELRRRFNNQYELGDGDLPPAEMLKELNYSKLVYIYRDSVREDAGSYLDYLDSEGMAVVREAL